MHGGCVIADSRCMPGEGEGEEISAGSSSLNFRQAIKGPRTLVLICRSVIMQFRCKAARLLTIHGTKGEGQKEQKGGVKGGLFTFQV